MSKEKEKGKAIRFVKGKYEGLNGWIDNSKKTKKKSFFQSVIVELDPDDEDDDEDRMELLKATKVKLSSFRDQFSSEASSFEEAILMQHRDIEKAMIELAELFAKCGNVNNNQVFRLLNDELDIAKKLQQKLGSKAKYRLTTYGEAASASNVI